MRDPAARAQIRRTLAADAELTFNFVVLTLASCAIATFGLLQNSAATIIGAMIVAPLMPAIQALSYGTLARAGRVVRRGAATLAAGVVLAVGFSALIAKSVGLVTFGSEIVLRTRPNLLDLGVALAAGGVGAFARVRPSIANTLAGTAIAVALMPPLCVVGIGIAAGRDEIAQGAALLFATNFLGIVLAGMVVLIASGYARRLAGVAVLWTAGLTALVAAPLAVSLKTLVTQAQTERALRDALTTRTVTFRHASLTPTPNPSP